MIFHSPTQRTYLLTIIIIIEVIIANSQIIKNRSSRDVIDFFLFLSPFLQLHTTYTNTINTINIDRVKKDDP